MNFIENKMNKEDLIKLLESLNFPKGEYYILGGSCLVICGLKEITADLDLCVSIELFEKLRKEYNLKEENKNACGFYPINDLIEIVPNKKANFTMQEINGYFVEDLNKILAFKKSRNLPKDQKDIENIEQYIKNKYSN